jgi:hypothetical protein
VYKFIFVIFLLFATNSHAESAYNITDKINENTSNQLIFEAFKDFEIDSELEFYLSISTSDHNIQLIQFGYLSKYSLNNHIPLLNNKFQYLHPRSPPFFII